MVLNIKKRMMILLMAGLAVSCDRTITLSVDEAKTKEIEFPCGRVSITAIKSFAPGYTISHRFALTKPVTLHFDSLRIEHRGTPLAFEITDENGGTINEKTITLSEEKVINAYIGENMAEGSTLLVNLKGFMVCDGASVYNDKVTVVLKEY
jgi:hypothetical protein